MYEKEAEEYAEGQFPHDEFLQSEISRKLVEFAEFSYNKAKEEDKEKLIGMTILPTVQFKRMDWNEDKLWTLIKRLKNDERTKDLFSFSEDKFGRFDFIFND